MGAWIETPETLQYPECLPVAPVWVRGLKHRQSGQDDLRRSRTRMGAWIETHQKNMVKNGTAVAPVWVRGLKQEELND